MFAKAYVHQAITVACSIQLFLGVRYVNCGVYTIRDTLYNYIFTNYSAKTLPVINPSQQAVVYVTAFVLNINNFEEKSGELSITISFHLSWIEERISWSPANYQNITSISVSPEDLWRPKLFLLESADYVRDIGNVSVNPRICNDGEVFWNAGNALKVSCSVDVTYFPFDKQTCELKFFTWDTGSSELIYYPNRTDVSLLFYSTNSQWELESGVMSNCTTIRPPCITLTFKLQRKSGFYVIYIVAPLILLTLINNLVFLMPASSGERTSVAVTTFLSFIVYMDIVNSLVPQSSDPMANIYIYIMILMTYSCVIMLLCIISLKIYDGKTEIPKTIKKIIWYLRLRFLFVNKARVQDVDKKVRQTSKMAFEHDDEIKRSQEQADENGNREECVDHTNNMIDEMGDITWFTVGKTFDMYCFTINYLALIIFSIQTFAAIS